VGTHNPTIKEIGLTMDKKQSFDIVKNTLHTLFEVQIKNDWNLTPDNIAKILENKGVELEWRKIENWEQFEAGNDVITNEYFIEILFSGINMENGNVIIITDECFNDKMAYNIKTNKTIEFIDNYERGYGIAFFQPSDYIFIFSDENIIVLLHHGGIYSKYNYINTSNMGVMA
jgi:hypothetical protein